MTPSKRATRRRETVTTERVTMVAHLLFTAPGHKLTTADVAQRLDMTHNGAWRMLTIMSRVTPIACDRDGWYYIGDVPY